MKSHSLHIATPVLVLGVVGIVIWANAGDLNPPPGPVGPTMKTIDELSAEHAQLAADIAALQGAIASPIKQVIRGVIIVPMNMNTQSQTFSPPVNPSKCMVILSDAVWDPVAAYYTRDWPRNGAALDSLTASQITVSVENGPVPMKVAYQIIEYN